MISAPSGAGKTSICKRFLKAFPEVVFSVSFTTRRPRKGEKEGRDYHFIPEEEFRKRIAQGEFVEWKENYGFLYGTSARMMRSTVESGRDLMLDVDTRGARALKERFPGGIYVFIAPPSLDVLKERLQRRASESDESLRVRLRNARNEIKEVFWYDYVIFNEKLEKAADELKCIYIAEKSRRERLTNRIKQLF